MASKVRKNVSVFSVLTAQNPMIFIWFMNFSVFVEGKHINTFGNSGSMHFTQVG